MYPHPSLPTAVQVNAHFFYSMDWKDCNNYVAKRYLEPDTPRDRYFNDIQMQMVSKRYARLYNASSPPKGVDFLHAFVIEVLKRDLACAACACCMCMLHEVLHVIMHVIMHAFVILQVLKRDPACAACACCMRSCM